MAARLTEHKALLEQLYVGDDLKVKEIVDYMQLNHQVDLNEGTYQRTFRKWGFKKNRNHNQWGWVDRKKRGREALGKRTQFTFNNRVVDDASIRKEISRNVTTAQQITTVATPGTPNGWTAFTPAATTPGGELSVPHTPRSESPIEREDGSEAALSQSNDYGRGNAANINLANPDAVAAQINVLARTMLDCGAFITTWARARLSTDHASMFSRYCELAGSIRSEPLHVFRVYEFPTPLDVLRLSFFGNYSQLDRFLRKRPKMSEDVLRTALFLTCKENQHHAANVLLSHGASPESRDTNGVPCLVVASRHNSDKVARVLLEFGADVDMADQAGMTSWSYICGLQSHDAVASVLSDAGTKKTFEGRYHHNPLYKATISGNVDAVRVMLKRGMNPSFATFDGWHPLHSAASRANTQIVKVLVEAGADLNHMTDDGRTPLDMAFDIDRHRDIRRFLISRGAKTGAAMRHGARVVGQNGWAESANEIDSELDSGIESDHRKDLLRTTKVHEIATRLNPPAFRPYIGPPPNLEMSTTNADSFNFSAKMAAIDISSSGLQNAPQHAAAAPAHSGLSEEPISSPWPISQFIRPDSTPTKFIFEQSPQFSGVSDYRTPMLENMTDAALNVWATPQMFTPNW